MELSKQDEDRGGRPDVDDHLIVPLSTQVVTILRKLREFSGNSKYVFPGLRTKERPMSENAVLAAMRRICVAKAALLPRNITSLPLLAPFYSAPVVYFYSALDNQVQFRTHAMYFLITTFQIKV